jgi:preprotein translocase subunit SecG
MATKSSFILAILFIANPFMLLFFQNCSVAPQHQASNTIVEKAATQNTSEEIVKNNN